MNSDKDEEWLRLQSREQRLSMLRSLLRDHLQNYGSVRDLIALLSDASSYQVQGTHSPSAGGVPSFGGDPQHGGSHAFPAQTNSDQPLNQPWAGLTADDASKNGRPEDVPGGPGHNSSTQKSDVKPFNLVVVLGVLIFAMGMAYMAITQGMRAPNTPAPTQQNSAQ